MNSLIYDLSRTLKTTAKNTVETNDLFVLSALDIKARIKHGHKAIS